MAVAPKWPEHERNRLMNVENPIIDHIGELREYDPQGQLDRERELWKCPGQGLVRLYRRHNRRP